MEAIARGIHRRLTVDVTDALVARFNARVHRREDDQCWPWLGAQRNGYGCIKHRNKVLSAHVVAWVVATGKQPGPDMLICHTCDNRICCNPSHIYEGSFADNVRDMGQRRVVSPHCGQQVPNAVLTDAIVRLIWSIRICNRWGQRKIAKAIGRSENAVEGVLYGNKWKHVLVPSQQEAAAIVHAWKSTHQPEQLATNIHWRGAAAARQAHNLEVGGSNPPARIPTRDGCGD